MKRLLRQLGSRAPAERAAAGARVAELSLGERQVLLNLLERRLQAVYSLDEVAESSILPITTVWPLMVFHGAVSAWMASRSWLARAVREIARIDDRRTVAPLIEALRFAHGDFRDVVCAALVRQLYAMTEADRGLIDTRKQRILLCELGRAGGEYYSGSFSAEIAIAILHALSAVGDTDAIPAVRQIACSPSGLEARKPIIAEARTCLAAMRSRAERERESRVLLLTVSGTGEAQHEFLVRPANEDSSDERVH